jgi:hypothetical protein
MKKLGPACLVVLLGLAGCGGEDSGDSSGPPLSDAGASASGAYALTTTLDLPATLLAPQPAADAFTTVKGLRQNPARTFFDLLDDAGVPRAQQLHQALPDVLQSRLDGWINGFVSRSFYRSRPVTVELDEIIALGEKLQVQVDVLSDLSLGPPDAAGMCTANHAVRGLRFTAFPDQTAITIPTLPATIASGITEAPLQVRLTAGHSGTDARLTAGDHAFGLPIGQYMVAALDASMRQRYGYDLRGALDLMIDCRLMASSVAHECVFSACVGHEEDLQLVCERGLDEVADRVKEKLLEHDFKAVHFASGTADFTAPGRLSGGVWKASVNVGQGERAVGARWSGVRR